MLDMVIDFYEIYTKYKEYDNDDSYNPTQKIVNKKALAEF